MNIIITFNFKISFYKENYKSTTPPTLPKVTNLYMTFPNLFFSRRPISYETPYGPGKKFLHPPPFLFQKFFICMGGETTPSENPQQKLASEG